MTNLEDQIEAAPEEGSVLKTEGEDVARAYAASAVPAGTDCPTIEVDRVRLAPPSQTPTVQLADLAKRPGPRAPDQMVKPEPKGPVELPDGRPVTKMQRIVIDSDFLIELARHRDEGKTRTVAEGEAAEVHTAEVVPAPVSTPDVVARPARKPVLMAVAIAVTAGVVVIAAMRPVRGPAEGAVPSATAVPSVMVTPSATAVPNVMVTPPPSTVPSAAAPPSTSARGGGRVTPHDPYDDPVVSAPSAHPIVPAPTPAPPTVAPGLPGGDKTEF